MNTFARSALLSLALATTGIVSEASAQNTVADWLRHMPVNGGRHFDTNRDGRADVITYDTNRDGRGEAARVSSNRDGYLDAVLLDTNRNGVYDQYIFDTNRDGHAETAVIDSNHDGLLDMMGYDLNRTGYYSGWRPYTPPASSAQQGGGGLTLTVGPSNAQQGGGGLTLTVGPSKHWTDGLPPGFGTGGSGVNAWLQPDPHGGGTVYDPVHPRDYGTYNDWKRYSRRSPDGTLYSTGRR